MEFEVSNITIYREEPKWLYDRDDPIWDKIKSFHCFDAGDRIPNEHGDGVFGASCSTLIIDDILHVIPDEWHHVAIAPSDPAIVVVKTIRNASLYKCEAIDGGFQHAGNQNASVHNCVLPIATM